MDCQHKKCGKPTKSEFHPFCFDCYEKIMVGDKTEIQRLREENGFLKVAVEAAELSWKLLESDNERLRAELAAFSSAEGVHLYKSGT